MIDSTKFGEITIDGKTHYSDVFIYWDGKIEEVRTEVRHKFSRKELNFLLGKNPEVVIVGNGQYGSLEVAEDVEKTAKEKGIEFIILDTPKAIQKFDELVKGGKKVVAYIHVTC